MVADDEQVNFAELVGRADELTLLVLGEIAEVEDAELAEVDLDAEGMGVFGLIGFGGGRSVATGVALACAGERVADELASAAESAGQEAAPIVDRLFGTRAAKRAPRWKCGNKRPNSSIV